MTFSEVLTKSAEEYAAKELRGFSGTPKDFASQVEVIKNLMRTDHKERGPRVNLTEALMSADASILFPKVISDIMLRPKEPIMIGQTLLSRTIQIDNVRSIEFPTMGAIRAQDYAEGMPMREQYLNFTQHTAEIKVGKSGVICSVSDEIIKDSMWDVLALYVEAIGFALLRHKEEKIFTEFSRTGHTVFDNSSTTAALWTHGKSYDQTNNYSVTLDDLIDMMGAVVAHEYAPTDFLLHPLAWVVLAKDPILRNSMFTQGQIGQSVWTTKPQFDQQVNMPWQVAYQVTPFVPLTVGGTLSTGPASGLGACNYTDIYVVDRNHSCIVLQREGMSMEDFNDPLRDIQSVKAKERYGVGVINGGRATCVGKNIRLVQNWHPVQVVGTVTPS